MTKAQRLEYNNILEKYAKLGVATLSSYTPKDTGETAASWGYRIESTNDSFSIIWTNNHIVDGCPIAIILQYGHATRNGGYVSGTDYINPAIQPVMDKLYEEMWKEVTSI